MNISCLYRQVKYFLRFSHLAVPLFRPIGELIVYACSVVRCPSVHHIQRSFSPKPLGQSKPNFIWSLHGSGERKFIHGVWVTWLRWPPRPYMVKPFKNLLLKNQRANDFVAWYVALGPWVHHTLFKWWLSVDLDLFFSKVKFGLLCFYIWRTVRKSFNGRNLQQKVYVFI